MIIIWALLLSLCYMNNKIGLFSQMMSVNQTESQTDFIIFCNFIRHWLHDDTSRWDRIYVCVSQCHREL